MLDAVNNPRICAACAWTRKPNQIEKVQIYANANPDNCRLKACSTFLICCQRSCRDQNVSLHFHFSVCLSVSLCLSVSFFLSLSLSPLSLFPASEICLLFHSTCLYSHERARAGPLRSNPIFMFLTMRVRERISQALWLLKLRGQVWGNKSSSIPSVKEARSKVWMPILRES